MRLGVVTSIPWLPGKSQEQCFLDALAEVEAAEALGFDAVWFTEHHFALHGLNSGLTTWLAAVAMRTRRVRIGSTVFVLPYWDPIRLAEDAATVDLLSGGRLEFGAGTGYRLDEFKGFNVSPDVSREQGRECIEVIRRLWTGEPVTFKGKYYALNEVAIRPVPKQRPHPPIWWPGQSPETLEYIARQGYHWMSAATLATTATIVARRQQLAELLARRGRSIDDIGIYVHVPAHVAHATRDEIRRVTEPGIRWFREAAMWYTAGPTPGGGTIYQSGGPVAPTPFDFDSFYDDNSFFGDPETCFHKIERLWQALRPTDLVFLFKIGQSDDQVLRSMELFAREVMPRVRELEPERRRSGR
jgi:alkanesulfonate monooxygenase SsuD/methylene tetrahydromethanopterin reductase-like flavin-dependent oxidoreductase (luciferase family)